MFKTKTTIKTAIAGYFIFLAEIFIPKILKA